MFAVFVCERFLGGSLRSFVAIQLAASGHSSGVLWALVTASFLALSILLSVLLRSSTMLLVQLVRMYHSFFFYCNDNAAVLVGSYTRKI